MVAFNVVKLEYDNGGSIGKSEFGSSFQCI
jgi:hypothetical protein